MLGSRCAMFGLFVAIAAAWCVVCSSNAVAVLTVERARLALLEGVRSGRIVPDLLRATAIKWADEMEKCPATAEPQNWHSVGIFRFNPSKHLYSYNLIPRPGIRACMLVYEGQIEFADGRWFCERPRLIQAAMMPGN